MSDPAPNSRFFVEPKTAPLKTLRQLGYIHAKRNARRIRRLFAQDPPPNHYLGNLIFHEQKKIVLLLPKVASRTLHTAFLGDDYAGVEDGARAPIDLAEKYAGYECGVVVRHPRHRAMSCYKDKIARLDNRFMRASRFARYMHLKPFMSFLEFAQWLNSDEGADIKADFHWASQQVLIEAMIGPAQPIKTFRLEDLDQRFESLCSWIGISPPEMPRIHSTGSANEAGTDEADEIAWPLIDQRYGGDITVFGYND